MGAESGCPLFPPPRHKHPPSRGRRRNAAGRTPGIAQPRAWGAPTSLGGISRTPTRVRVRPRGAGSDGGGKALPGAQKPPPQARRGRRRLPLLSEGRAESWSGVTREIAHHSPPRPRLGVSAQSAPANLCVCVRAHAVTRNGRCRNLCLCAHTGTYAHAKYTYFCIRSRFGSYLLWFFCFRGRFRLEDLQSAILVDQIPSLDNTPPFVSFHPRCHSGFRIIRVAKGLVVLGRVRTGKGGIKGPFLMDCSRLNSIPGGNKKRGFIWVLLSSWLASLGLLLVFLIRETLPNEKTSIVHNAPAPSGGSERLQGSEGPPGGASGCRWPGALPLPSGSSPLALLCPRFSTGSPPRPRARWVSVRLGQCGESGRPEMSPQVGLLLLLPPERPPERYLRGSLGSFREDGRTPALPETRHLPPRSSGPPRPRSTRKHRSG